MTLTFKLDLGSVKMNQHPVHLGRRSSSWEVISGHTDTCTPDYTTISDHVCMLVAETLNTCC